MTQLSFSNVGVDFGATHLFSGVTFTVAQRERWGIVGRNGTGKTTLFRLLTGEMQPTRGIIANRGSVHPSSSNTGSSAEPRPCGRLPPESCPSCLPWNSRSPSRRRRLRTTRPRKQ